MNQGMCTRRFCEDSKIRRKRQGYLNFYTKVNSIKGPVETLWSPIKWKWNKHLEGNSVTRTRTRGEGVLWGGVRGSLSGSWSLIDPRFTSDHRFGLTILRTKTTLWIFSKIEKVWIRSISYTPTLRKNTQYVYWSEVIEENWILTSPTRLLPLPRGWDSAPDEDEKLTHKKINKQNHQCVGPNNDSQIIFYGVKSVFSIHSRPAGLNDVLETDVSIPR